MVDWSIVERKRCAAGKVVQRFRLPASATRSRIRPLLAVVRLILWPSSTSRRPLTMISVMSRSLLKF